MLPGGRLHRVCLEAAVKHLGSDIMGQVDQLVFHRLEQSNLSQMVDLMTQRLNDWLRPRDYQCELRPAARDLLLSGQIPPGGKLVADRHGEEAHLHFTVEPPDTNDSPSVHPDIHERRIPVT